MKWLKALLVAGLAGAAFLAVRHIDLNAGWQILRSLSLAKIVIIVIFLPLAFNVAVALRWQLLLKSLGYLIPLRKLIAMNIAGFAASTLVPSFDIAGRSAQVFLLSKERVPAASALISISLDAILGTGLDVLIRSLIFLALGIAGVKTTFGFIPILAASLIFAGLAVILVFPDAIRRAMPRAIAERKAIEAFFRHLGEAKARLASGEQRRFILLALVAGLAAVSLGILELGIIAKFLGIRAGFESIILAQTAYRYAGMLPGGSIGALEQTLVGIFWESGGQLGAALALALRFKDLPWILTGLAVLLTSGAFRRRYR